MSIFTVLFFINVMNFLKMKLTRNFWRKYFNILFTFLRIHMSWNLLNLSQHTSVLEIQNLRWKRLLSQVTLCPLLIKQLYLCRLRWESLIIYLLICHHILLPHPLRISVHIGNVSPMVFMWSYLLSLHPLVPLILHILVCCVRPSWISHVIITRINFWMKLLLSSQPTLLFLKSMCGSLNKNLWQRMTSLCPLLIHFILKSSMILPILFHLLKIHFWMFPLPIIRRTHGMPFFHLIAESINFSFWIL